MYSNSSFNGSVPNEQNSGGGTDGLLSNQDENNNNDKSLTLLNNGMSSGDDVNMEFITTISTSLLNSNRLNLFYLHFGACSLVWFIYLPILVILSVLVLTDLFRFRLMLSTYKF